MHNEIASLEARLDNKDKDIAQLVRLHMDEVASKDDTIAEQRTNIDRLRKERNQVKKDNLILKDKYRIAVRRVEEAAVGYRSTNGDTSSSHGTTSSPASSRSSNHPTSDESPPLYRTSKRSRPPTLSEESDEEVELDSFAVNDWVDIKKVKNDRPAKKDHPRR